jgi:hypothetical protein
MLAARPQDPCPTPPFHQFVSPAGTVWTEFHRRGTAYLLRFPGYADFDVSADGATVTCHPTPESDHATTEHLFINQVLPLALSRQGRLAFHASAVAVPGGAVAFLGRTGMGKSTLAASFARSGGSFLTDDGLLLLASGDGFLVQPNHPSIRLWEDSHTALMDGRAERAPAVSFTSKARVLAGDALPHCDAPKRLIAACVLDTPVTEGIVIRRASETEAVLGWIRNSFVLDVEDPVSLAQHFQNATMVARAVPTYHLDYPREFARLPEVQAAILDRLLEDAREDAGDVR